MSKIVFDKTIKERRVSVTFETYELLALLLEPALQAAGMTEAGSTTASIKIEQLEEGSPSYKVQQWRTFVEIVEKL